MANILITGGSGYVGTHVMRRLRDRHTVKVSEFRADDYVFDDLGIWGGSSIMRTKYLGLGLGLL